MSTYIRKIPSIGIGIAYDVNKSSERLESVEAALQSGHFSRLNRKEDDMKLPKGLRKFCALFMAIHLSNIPSQVFAESKMISTSAVMNQSNRRLDEERIRETLNDKKVRDALASQGLSIDEVNARIASLSDPELKNLSNQMEQARYGGDVLVTILIVVLIIFLIKRI